MLQHRSAFDGYYVGGTVLLLLMKISNSSHTRDLCDDGSCCLNMLFRQSYGGNWFFDTHEPVLKSSLGLILVNVNLCPTLSFDLYHGNNLSMIS